MASKKTLSPHHQLMAYAKKVGMPKAYFGCDFNTDDIKKDVVTISSNPEDSDLPLFPYTVNNVDEMKAITGVPDHHYTEKGSSAYAHPALPEPLSNVKGDEHAHRANVGLAHEAYLYGNSANVAEYKDAINETFYPRVAFAASGETLTITKPTVITDPTSLSYDTINIKDSGSLSFQDGGGTKSTTLTDTSTGGTSIINIGQPGKAGGNGTAGDDGKAGGAGGGASSGKDSCNTSATNGGSGQAGGAGTGGGAGSVGTSGAAITIQSVTINGAITLQTKGGDGGNGGNGANGGKGGDGGKGGNGDGKCDSANGGKGGDGGTGGGGGNGANGGDAGSISVTYSAGSPTFDASGSGGGAAGTGGTGGNGGQAGQGGAAGTGGAKNGSQGAAGTQGVAGAIGSNGAPGKSGTITVNGSTIGG